jgi:transposase-like protein
MAKRYSQEFKAEAVRLILEENMTQAQVSRDLGVSETSIGRWLAQAEIDAGRGPAGALTTEERAELRELRRENRRLRMEREILKKAAAFFAKESL